MFRARPAMPELPEVEVTRRGIAPVLTGGRVAGVVARVPALRYPLPQDLQRTLGGCRLAAVKRRGKYLLLDFGHGHLLIHLGMSGSLRLVPAALAAEKHDHFDLIFTIKRKPLALRLRDPRRFGAVLWLAGDPLAHPLLAVLGVEPLTDAFNAAWLQSELAGLAAAIKPTLMDSHRVVGIGNIYASESLFRAGIDPRTAAGRISPKRLQRLVPAIKTTLAAAIDAGGSSLRDFMRSDGSSGYFQQQYFVYGRGGEPCHVCGRSIRELRQGQRATFFCACCQRSAESLLFGQLGKLHHQLILRFHVIRIVRNAIYRADFAALRRIEMPDAFGALVWIDDVSLFALRNRVVGAFRLANVAVDAFIGDHQGHAVLLRNLL